MKDEGLRLKEIVRSHGYFFQKILVTNERHAVLIAKRQGRTCVLKLASREAERENLRNEAFAHQFLRPLVPRNTHFTFPISSLVQDDVYLITEHDYLSGKWLASKDPHRLSRPLTNTDLEDIFQIILFLRQLSRNSIPDYFLQRASNEFGLRQTLEKQARYFQPALGTLLDESEAETLQHMMRTIGYKRAFVHHDILPSNLVRLRDEKLCLIDAEFARWEMKWYDLAYFFLQMSLLYGYERLAQRSLRYFVTRFKQELPHDDLEQELFFPLGYWIAANMFMEMQRPRPRPKVRAQIRQVFKAILHQRLDVLMG